MLLEKDQLEEALKLAQSKQLNSDLVYKRMIQKQCTVWNDLSQKEWMQSPCYDCSEIFQILNHSSLSLLLYVFDFFLKKWKKNFLMINAQGLWSSAKRPLD